MSKQTLAVIAGAIALFVIAIGASFAFVGGDSDDGKVHTMPDGRTMTGMDMP